MNCVWQTDVQPSSPAVDTEEVQSPSAEHVAAAENTGCLNTETSHQMVGYFNTSNSVVIT